MHQSTFGEKITAAISTVVAIALLGAAVSAQQARAPQGDRLATLESDLRYQLDLAFRHDRPAHKARLADVDQTLAAWRGSPRTAQDDQLLVGWLRAAIAASMPGRSGDFPATPQFSPAATRPRVAPPRAAAASPLHAAVLPPRKVEPVLRVTPPIAVIPPAAPPDSQHPTVAPPAEPAAMPTPPTLAARASQNGAVDSAPSVPRRTAAAPVTPAFSASEPTPPVAEQSIAPRAAPPRPARVTYPGPLPPLPVTNAALPYNTEEGPAVAATPTSASAPPVVQINLRELNARIIGYHQELGEIEAATVVDGTIGAAKLEQLVARLEALAGQYQLVRLYHETLTDAERRQVAEPRPLDEVIELIQRHVKAADDAGDIFAEFDAGETADDSEGPAGEQSTLAARLQAITQATGVSGD